ncbi:MAG TPA: alpha/beta fold hydrolase [Gemmatimonadaceae bacterium]|nr:alpha/beta fold hydrolase [Gemmatimonadaceae bacterium]
MKRMRMLSGWLVTLVLLAIGVLTVSWLLGSLLVRSASTKVAAAHSPARDLRIVTSDGLSLAATYWQGRNADAPGVLLLHGNGASRMQTADNAAWFAERGYAALAIDFRGNGESAPSAHSFGFKESRDARAAFDWLKQQQHGARVGVIGISMGGAAALLGDDGPLSADALVLQAVYPDIRHTIRNRMASMISRVPAIIFEPLLSYQSRLRFGVWPSRLSPIDALARYRGPVLVIGGASDPFTPPDETTRMYDAVQGPRTLWLVPGESHEGISDLRSAEYRDKVLSFFEHAIGAP